jgi:hypothetical protein
MAPAVIQTKNWLVSKTTSALQDFKQVPIIPAGIPSHSPMIMNFLRFICMAHLQVAVVVHHFFLSLAF